MSQAPPEIPTLPEFLAERAPELAEKTFEHLVHLTLLPVGIAVLIGVPLGILVSRVTWLRGPVLGTTGLIQTLPSLAMLAFLLPFLGTGKTNAVVALTLYALFPIVMNTATGLRNVPNEMLEAADGVGFTRFQRLRMVELPLALPVIIAGIRTAAVIDVGIATLSTYIGAGGLGDFIQRGMAMRNNRLTMLGTISAMALALLVFATIGLIERLLTRRRPRHA